MDLLHQRLQRAPTDLAQVALVVRHELLAVASAVDADARPPQIVVRFAQAAIANERRFRSYDQIRAATGATGKQKPSSSGPALQVRIRLKSVPSPTSLAALRTR